MQGRKLFDLDLITDTFGDAGKVWDRQADHDDGPDALEMLWRNAVTSSAPIEWIGLNDEDLGHDDFDAEDDLYSIWRG